MPITPDGLFLKLLTVSLHHITPSCAISWPVTGFNHSIIFSITPLFQFLSCSLSFGLQQIIYVDRRDSGFPLQGLAATWIYCSKPELAALLLCRDWRSQQNCFDLLTSAHTLAGTTHFFNYLDEDVLYLSQEDQDHEEDAHLQVRESLICNNR